jgi:electron-transferring-flavoprotein dehydrogenase
MLNSEQPVVERQTMDVDIVCVGFGPAMGGFLTTLARGLTNPDGTPAVESRAMPGMPPQVLCYERADDIGFGVSGVVTRARGIRQSFPDLDLSQIPLAAPVAHETVAYLLDPIGASRRPPLLRLADRCIRIFRGLLPCEHEALELPYVPPFLRKDGGLLLSVGQFNQWVGSQVMGTGAVQIWPGMPVAEPLWENGRVGGVRLTDQGTDLQGRPETGFLPGMDIRAALTVIGDGPVGPVGRQIDEKLGLPEGHHRREWAVGAKVVVDLPEHSTLEPGTALHTFGYPEPEIFGFLYVYPGRIVSAGIFVPSWFDSPVRTSYRYLQHWMLHPYLWRHLAGGRLRSWGAKTLQESGKRGEPRLVGDGFVRIGEGSGSTNVLTGSGVDEAWTTGVLAAEGVLELLRVGQPFTRENLERAYVARRRVSWVEAEGRVAEKARDGFTRGVVSGLVGMALAGLTQGRVAIPGKSLPPAKRLPTIEEYYAGRIAPEEIARLRQDCAARGLSLHNALMDRCGWPAIPHDGQLLVSHQDALLMGGKVQAPPGYANHVVFLYPNLCEACGTKICIEMCSGQAITAGDTGVPAFDRDKCVHCGACLWNCAASHLDDPERAAIEFRGGTGGLHSAEN